MCWGLCARCPHLLLPNCGASDAASFLKLKLYAAKNYARSICAAVYPPLISAC